MMVGTLSLVQKGQTRGCSGRSTQWNSGIWWWGHCLWYKKVKLEDAVDAVHSGIVVYGVGDIVFGAKRSNQWIQWMQSHSGHITQWTQYAVGPVHSGCSTQWMQYAVDAVCSGRSGRSGRSRLVVYGGGDIVFDTKRSNQRTQWTQYTV